MTWTIRVEEVPGDLRKRAANLDRQLRLSQLERRRARLESNRATEQDSAA